MADSSCVGVRRAAAKIFDRERGHDIWGPAVLRGEIITATLYFQRSQPTRDGLQLWLWLPHNVAALITEEDQVRTATDAELGEQVRYVEFHGALGNMQPLRHFFGEILEAAEDLLFAAAELTGGNQLAGDARVCCSELNPRTGKEPGAAPECRPRRPAGGRGGVGPGFGVTEYPLESLESQQ